MRLTIENSQIQSACQPKRRSLRLRVSEFFALARQRRQLAELDPHILSDIGLTQAQAAAEAQKTPWDVPNHWQN